MKWLRNGLAIILVLLLGMTCAAAQEQRVRAYSEEVPLEDLMENGVVVLRQSHNGSAYIEYIADSDSYYSVRLLGTAQNGEDFSEYSSISEGWGYGYYHAAQEAGTYGPYRLQILGEDYLQEYDVVFEVEESEGGNYPGFAERGSILYADFALHTKGTLQTKGGMAITSPDGNYPLSGAPGYLLSIGFNRGETLPSPIYLQMLDAETGELVLEQEIEIDEYYQDKTDIYTSVVIPAFESGKRYRLVVSSGDLSGEQEIVLINENEGRDISVDEIGVMSCNPYNYSEEPVPFENLMDENGVVHLTTNNQGELCLQAVAPQDSPLLRITWLGQTTYGGELNSTNSLSSDSGLILTITDRPGVYPLTLRVQNRNAVMEYQLSVTVPENTNSRHAGMLNYYSDGLHHFASRWDLEEAYRKPVAANASSASFSKQMGGDGAVFAGSPGYRLPVYFDLTNVPPKTWVGLYDYDAKRWIDRQEIWYSGREQGLYGNGSQSGSLEIDGFNSGSTYGLYIRTPNGDDLARQDIVLISEDDLFTGARTAPLDSTLYSGQQLIPLVEQTLADMSVIQLSSADGFRQHRCAPAALDGVVAGSFAVYDPILPMETANYEVMDLESSANRALYEQYLMQFTNGTRYQDMQPINLQALDAQFADGWQDLTIFDFAQGVARGEDGTDYFFAPVYYRTEEGGILNDLVYLYVMTVHNGMDRAPIDAHENFTWIDTGEKLCAAQRLLITDQAAVAAILQELRLTSGDWPMPDVSGFENWNEGMQSRAVRRMQTALMQLGFFDSPRDGIYGKATMNALKAYQQARKLKATGKVNPATLEALYAEGDTRTLLRTWLENR